MDPSTGQPMLYKQHRPSAEAHDHKYGDISGIEDYDIDDDQKQQQQQQHQEIEAAALREEKRRRLLFLQQQQQQQRQQKAQQTSNFNKKTSNSVTPVIPVAPMRGMNVKISEPSMDFLVRLAEVNTAVHAASEKQLEQRAALAKLVEEEQAKIEMASGKKTADVSEIIARKLKRPPPPPPDLTRLLVELDIKNDRQWGIPSLHRGILFFTHLILILLFTIFIPWSIVRARNSEVSLWSLQNAASWTRLWLDSDKYPTHSSSSSAAAEPIPSTTFAVSGNDAIVDIFQKMFQKADALPSSWIPVGSLVFSVAMADSAKVLCPTTIAPVPAATTTTTPKKVSCMPYDISVSTGLSTSASYRIQGITSSSSSRPRINIDPVSESVLAKEGDLLCLGSVCAPESFRQVGWSFPSVNQYPHDPSNFLKWRLAAVVNSTAWQDRSVFENDKTQNPQRVLYYSTTERNGPPGFVSTLESGFDAIANLVKVPGPYLALALGELTVFDSSSDSLLFLSMGFETQGGAGGFTGKLTVSSFSMGSDARSVAVRTFALIFSVCLLAYAVLLPFVKVYYVRNVANCAGCIFNETLKRRPFRTITWATCISPKGCGNPLLVKGALPFKCDSCGFVQPAAEHHRCWRGWLCDPGWLLSFLCGLLGLLWGGSDGVTLGHVSDFLETVRVQVANDGASFLSMRNISNLINLHQSGLGAVIIFLAALNAQRVFWHVFGGQIGLAWLATWRKSFGVCVNLFVVAVVVGVISSWAVGLPDYRVGAAQGSVTESFSPPGIAFTWGQSTIWWFGRWVILSLAAYGVAICASAAARSSSNSDGGGGASSSSALMTYDPDWQSLKLCWIEVGKYFGRGVDPVEEEEKKRDEERLMKKKQEQEQQQQQEGEGQRPQQQQQQQGEVNAASSPPAPQPQPQPAHPIDGVLDALDEEEALSADPLTTAVDKLEHCVSKLMAQLPPILEDAVDERVHFSLMEKSRSLAFDETETVRAAEQGEAMRRLEEMRQQEWNRQAKMLDEVEDFVGSSNEAEDDDDDDDDDDVDQLVEIEGAVASRKLPTAAGVGQSSPSSSPSPSKNKNLKKNKPKKSAPPVVAVIPKKNQLLYQKSPEQRRYAEKYGDWAEYNDGVVPPSSGGDDFANNRNPSLSSAPSTSAPPLDSEGNLVVPVGWRPPGWERKNQLLKKKNGSEQQQHVVDSDIDDDDAEANLPEALRHVPSSDFYGRGVTPSAATTTSKQNKGTNNGKKSTHTTPTPSPPRHRYQQQQQQQQHPDFAEYTDFQEAAQAALRGEEVMAMASATAPPVGRGQQQQQQQRGVGGMQYLSPSEVAATTHQHRPQRPNDTPFVTTTGAAAAQHPNSQQQQQQQQQSGLPPLRADAAVLPHEYRSQNPEDYVVEPMLDDDEIEDLLMRPRQQQQPPRHGSRRRGGYNNFDDDDDDDYDSRGRRRRQPSPSSRRDYEYGGRGGGGPGSHRSSPSSSSHHHHSPSSRHPQQQQQYDSQQPSPSPRQQQQHAAGDPSSSVGRVSGLPPSRILNEPSPTIGRPFGGAPSSLTMPQPTKYDTTKPKHY